MTANVLSRIFTIEIGDAPTLTFEAQNLREAQELCHEQWLKDDLAEAKSDSAPLWEGKANLRARMARPHENALFAEAKDNGQPSDGLMLVYLVELNGEATDEEPVDPGAFRPGRDRRRSQPAYIPVTANRSGADRERPPRCSAGWSRSARAKK